MHSTKQGQWKVSCIQAYEQKSKNFTFHQSFLSEIFKNQTPLIQKLPRNITVNMSFLSPNVTVRVRPNNNWSRKVKIISKCEQPRSYNVLTEKGTTLRRNRRHPLKTDEQFEVQPEIEYDEIDVSFTKQGSQVASEPSCTILRAMFKDLLLHRQEVNLPSPRTAKHIQYLLSNKIGTLIQTTKGLRGV